MQKQIAAANWKMNLTFEEAKSLISEILQAKSVVPDGRLAIFAVPFPYLLTVKEMLRDAINCVVAAQNCAATNNGAFTGEVSAAMLESMEIVYVIIGHSERREYFLETNDMLASKVERAFEYNLKPVFCCGEPLHIREAGNQNEFVAQQLRESLFRFSKHQLQDFIIAYEPIWAIGTGKTATSDQAQEMHSHIRNVLREQFDEDLAKSLSILYGGSVKGANATEIFSRPDVDGGLVGGASLNAAEFVKIIESLK